MFEGKKITKATFKSFIKKHQDKLMIKVSSKFDGMIDGCERLNGGFTKALPADRVFDNNLGIQGVWLVQGSRDYFSAYSDDNFVGIRVYNCCGDFTIAIPK